MYYVCIICMYQMYVLYVCIICMYYMCYMYVKLRGQVALRGQKVHGKRKLRIQGRMQIFEKMSQMALNHVLILPSFRAQKMLQIRLKIMDLQNNWFCGKFKHCKFRMLVPM